MTTTMKAVQQKQAAKAEAFRKLHQPGNPVVLYNVWDAGSARAVAKSGAGAIATSSWAVAKAHGFEDGEHFPFELAIRNLEQIVEAVELPVTFDIESGYGEAPETVGKNIALAIDAGAVGCNFEDSIPASDLIRDTVEQLPRIAAIRKAADAANVAFFINARCDLFFQGDAVPHDAELLAKLIDRTHAYANAGADGLFVPGLTTISLIAKLTAQSPIPINILADSSLSLTHLRDSGVARVSYGATPFVVAMDSLEKSAHAITG